MKRLRLLPIVMALAMIFCFSALSTFADSGVEYTWYESNYSGIAPGFCFKDGTPEIKVESELSDSVIKVHTPERDLECFFYFDDFDNMYRLTDDNDNELAYSLHIEDSTVYMFICDEVNRWETTLTFNNASVDNDVVKIVYETALPISLYSEDIKDKYDAGTEYFNFKNRSIHSKGGATWKSPFCVGDKLIVYYSNNTTKSYIDKDIDLNDFFVLDGIESNYDSGKYISVDSDSELQAGNNTVQLYCHGRTTSVDVYVETPEMRAKRLAEEARIRAQQEEKARLQAELARWNGVPDSSQPKLKAVKTKAAKKKATVKWKKIDKKKLKVVGQIEVQYSLNPNFPMEQTTCQYVGKKKTSYKIRGLVSKKTYYVRVRTIRDIGGTRYVGPWGVKSVKVK